MINLGAWAETAITVTASIFIVLYTIKMLGWLLGVKRIHERIKTLYKHPITKTIYFTIHVFASLLLLTEVSAAGYIVAVLAIGGLYDYFFAVFPDQSRELVLTSMASKQKMWYFGITFPLIMLVMFLISFIN